MFFLNLGAEAILENLWKLIYLLLEVLTRKASRHILWLINQ